MPTTKNVAIYRISYILKTASDNQLIRKISLIDIILNCLEFKAQSSTLLHGTAQYTRTLSCVDVEHFMNIQDQS